MAITAAQLVVKVTADTTQAEEGLGNVGKVAEESGGGLQSFLGNMLGIGAGMVAIDLATTGFNFLKDQLTEAVSEGEHANQVMAQTTAVLNSTHDASGLTAQSITDLATHMMDLTGIQDDAVQTGENMLLTFTNIGGSVIPAATQAVADLATKMNGGAIPSAQQMQQEAILVGKALDDPTKGLTALTRVGVTFSAQQKEQIKTMMAAGDTAGAQKIILGELNKEFGGSAQAAGHANGGIAILTAKMDDMRKTIGQDLIPIIGSLVSAFMPLVNTLVDDLPGALSWVEQHSESVKVVLASLAAAAIPALIGALIPLVGILWAAMAPIIAGAAPFILLGVAIAGVALYFKHLYDTSAPFRTTIHGLVSVVSELAAIFQYQLQVGLQAIMPYLQQAAHWLGDELGQAAKAIQPVILQAAAAIETFARGLETRLGPAIAGVFGFIQAALPILAELWSDVWPTIQAVLEGVWNVIQGVVKIAWSIVSGIINVGLDLLSGNWSQAWTDIKTMFSGIWDGIKQILSGAWEIIKSLFTAGIAFVVAGWHAFWTNLINFVSGMQTLIHNAIQQHIITPIHDAISSMITDAEQWGHNLIQMFINGISNMAGAVKNAAQNVMNGVKNIFGFHSPAKEGPGADADTWAPNLMKMFAAGIVDATPLLSAAAAGAMGGVRAGLSGSVSPSMAASLMGPSTAQMMTQAITASGSGAGGSGAGGGLQPAIITLDGLRVGTALIPYIGQAARIATGVRTS